MEKDFWDYLNIIGSLTISTVTLILAYRIYRKVSFKKSVLDKQFETVTQLIQVLQETNIIIIIVNSEPDFSLAHSQPFFSIEAAKEKFKKAEGAKIYFTPNFIANLPFRKFARHPFIPIEIANCIDNFFIYLSKKKQEQNSNKFVKIDFWYNSIEHTDDSELLSCENHEIGLDFDSFFRICVKLDFEIKVWLKKYGVKDLNLR